MIVLFLALVITPEEINDLEFRVAQEEWVCRNFPCDDLSRVLSSRGAWLVKGLGQPGYLDREAAHLMLWESRDMRAMVWGSRDSDSEISSRCNEMLDNLLVCDHCLGSRDCPYKGPNYWSQCKVCQEFYMKTNLDWVGKLYYDKKCIKCFGTGKGRAKTPVQPF